MYGTTPLTQSGFDDVVAMIETARTRAYQAVNTELVTVYWQIGEHISRKIASAEWGDKVVEQLAQYLAQTQPGLKGFTRPNLFRMRQFYEIYRDNEIVSPLVRQLPWTHNVMIMSYCKHPEEREFYLRTTVRERWSKRELERQLDSGLFLRAVANPPIVSTLLREMHPLAPKIFNDSYSLEFLGLADTHSEPDLHAALIAEYQTRLPDKKLLQAKLHEFYQLLGPSDVDTPRRKRKEPAK